VTDGKWTIWNRDKPWKIDTGMDGISENTYGHHPLYLARERQSKLYHLAYFKNTNGLFIESNKKTHELIYHSIGGPLHFLIILGQENPEPVLEKYHDYIGKGHIPPFWSFGHHQCRWGYKSLSDIK
jgi:alpha-glucosidase (family GH31 glycosyl hydrolase)